MLLHDKERKQYPGLCYTKHCQQVILVLWLALGKQTWSALSSARYPKRMDILDIYYRATKTVRGLEHLLGEVAKRARMVQL